MRSIASVVLTVLACGLIGSAQQQTLPSEQRDVMARVAALSARLEYRDDNEADKDRYFRELEEVTRRIRAEIDNHIQATVNVDDTSQQVQDRLTKLLARTPHPQYGDAPFARSADLPAGRSLLVAYTIVRPPHHDSATVRGYRLTSNTFELVAVSEDDFDGYNMFKRELRSPVPGELWLLAWGQAQGANGKIVRFRAYAFNGETLRTVWSPEDMFDADVRFSDSGFAIDHYRRPHDIHDEYLLTPDGPLKTTPN
jgi:hypothetical protein